MPSAEAEDLSAEAKPRDPPLFISEEEFRVYMEKGGSKILEMLETRAEGRPFWLMGALKELKLIHQPEVSGDSDFYNDIKKAIERDPKWEIARVYTGSGMRVYVLPPKSEEK